MTSNSLSSVLGWISIACWIVVYSPQLLENYTRQSGEGLSVLFVVIWLLGDITNLLGAIIAGLLPTVIILAVYYMTCDSTLLFQIYFYRWKRSRLAAQTPRLEGHETRPLLLGEDDDRPEEIVPWKTLVMRYIAALAFVIIVGLMAWWITTDEEDRGFNHPTLENTKRWWTVQILGWSSAFLFLGARVPQILKNFETRCEGLSPALFFFAIFGNSTYALSICAKSTETEYLIKNAGWLAGSACTVVLDIFVLCQFCYYRYSDKIKARVTTIEAI